LTSAVLQTHVDHLGERAGRLDTKDDMNLSEGVVGLLNCCYWALPPTLLPLPSSLLLCSAGSSTLEDFCLFVARGCELYSSPSDSSVRPDSFCVN
jgi:hypothetical protein